MAALETAGRHAPRLSGLSIIVVATIASGAFSYVVTWLVPHRVGLADYAIFAIFWSFLYFVVGALSGIQQEITRATRQITIVAFSRVQRARNFGLISGAAVFVLLAGTAPLWVRVAFPVGGWDLVWPLCVGAASYVLVAVVCGSLYGVSRWAPLGLMISIDALARLIAVAIVLTFSTDIVALAWAVALPFPLVLIILWPFIRRSIVGQTQLDVGYSGLTRNVLQTVVAAASTGLMVSGFPLMLGITAWGESRNVVGLYILCITLTRAPLIVVALSLQSYFVVAFRAAAGDFWKTFLRLQTVVLVVAIPLAAAGWLAGPTVFAFLFPGQLRPSGGFIVALVLSSALVAALCVSASAALSRSHHTLYSGGWLAAAVFTVGILLLPLDFAARTTLALIAGPLVGLLVHVLYFVVNRRRRLSADREAI